MSQVQLNFWRTYAAVHPEGKGIAELLKADVSHSRLLQLYPVELAAVQGWLYDREVGDQVDFIALSKPLRALMFDLNLDLTGENYDRLSGALAVLREYAAVALHPAEREYFSLVAQILWLASRWEHVPELTRHAEAFAAQLAGARQLVAGNASALG